MNYDEIDNIEGYGEPEQVPIKFKKGNLNEVICQLVEEYPDAVFHIGAGSSYLFIGDFEHFKVDMPEISKALMESMKIRLDKAKTRLAENRNTRFYCGDDQPLVFARHIEAVAKQIRDDVDVISKMEKRIPAFRLFEERPVKEVTKMITKDNFIRIIVAGDENGSYWFKSEYDKARRGFKWVKNKEE